MSVRIIWPWCINVDRGILNVKLSKDQLKGEKWEAHHFSVHLRVVVTLAGDTPAPLTLGKRK